MKRLSFVIVLIALIIVPVIYFFVMPTEYEITESTDEHMMSFYIEDNPDGRILETVSSVPTGYLLDDSATTCTNNATVRYDSVNNKVLLKSSGSTQCRLYFYNNSTIHNLASQIKGLAINDTTSFGIDHNTNYRYIGSDPHNYVRFNNEEWRIIGAFDGKVKLIRSEGFNDIFSSEHTNNFANASIKTTLDNIYNSFSATSKSMTDNVLFFYGGINKWNNPNVSTSYDGETASNAVFTNIGLPYVSDYGYASGGENRDTCLSSSVISNADCKDDNWLYQFTKISETGTRNFYTMTPTNYESQYVHQVQTSGKVDINPSWAYATMYPTIYLNAGVGYVSGDGTKNNPYLLRLDKAQELVYPLNVRNHIASVSNNNSTLVNDITGEYRYVGTGPNNYLMIEDDLWRIIGLLDGRLKIVKSVKIGNSVFDSDDERDFETSDMKVTLDNYYEGLSSEYKSLIDTNSTWSVAPVKAWGAPAAKNMYAAEKVGPYVTRAIGLISPSDYSLGVDRSDNNDCLNTGLEAWAGFTSKGCNNKTWLKSFAAGNASFTMHPSSNKDSEYMITIHINGISMMVAKNNSAVYPAAYLKSNVVFTAGDGSKLSPFRVGLPN